ncbi:MAG: sugar phosphate nucleotidyltransferase, partial [Gemmatimonadota bacterium]|nr:sugar phosphate nucleotidyltransferase [Gemmatimonadota bacterium]
MTAWAVILAGGSGTRFWPLSTPKIPKQMLTLASSDPLLRQAVDRLSGLIPPERILILTGSALEDDTRKMLPDIPRENILIEPRAASTAPALVWATYETSVRDSEAVILSLHADWFVGDDQKFRETAELALDAARERNMLVTVGMVPSRPDTGYGYIQKGERLDEKVHLVKQFKEKPDLETARNLIDEGALWNSGLFAWPAKLFLEETE